MPAISPIAVPSHTQFSSPKGRLPKQPGSSGAVVAGAFVGAGVGAFVGLAVGRGGGFQGSGFHGLPTPFPGEPLPPPFQAPWPLLPLGAFPQGGGRSSPHQIPHLSNLQPVLNSLRPMDISCVEAVAANTASSTTRPVPENAIITMILYSAVCWLFVTRCAVVCTGRRCCCRQVTQGLFYVSPPLGSEASSKPTACGWTAILSRRRVGALVRRLCGDAACRRPPYGRP